MTTTTTGTTRQARIFVNPERTVLVTLWPSGVAEVATREYPAHTWGPPTTLYEEKRA